MTQTIAPSRDIARLIEIMEALRTPVTGCPWDLVQTFETIAPYTIEEAYEVSDAISRNDMADLKDELGDLLLQVVYHARMAEEAGAFAFGDVVEAITRKMIRRHPHVFGDGRAREPSAVKETWEEIKAAERAEKAQERERLSGGKAPATTESTRSKVLADIPASLPALTRAVKLQDRAAKVGFDWPSIAPVFEKLKEETAELEAEISALPDDAAQTNPTGPIAEELGDLLFVVANIARHLKQDPEEALRRANAKFMRRFTYIEARLASAGKTPAQSSLEEMDAYWNEARAADKLKPASRQPQ